MYKKLRIGAKDFGAFKKQHRVLGIIYHLQIGLGIFSVANQLLTFLGYEALSFSLGLFISFLIAVVPSASEQT